MSKKRTTRSMTVISERQVFSRIGIWFVFIGGLLFSEDVALAEFEINYSRAEFKIVDTDHGPIRGFTMPLMDNPSAHFEAYVGIPYAKPPVGQQRWKPPEDLDSWTETEIYNATAFKPCCMQPLGILRSLSFGPEYNNTSEDCLYLNVFSVNTTNQTSPKPVMVWIHGGSYRYGCGEEYDARVLAQQDVVVVTINYRLGPFGFLSTDDENAPGNYGLLDMVAALHWVQNNIDKFGGNPNSVTVFGNSAGGAAVSLLMFSHLSSGLIHRVIAESGDALARWAIYRPPHKNLPCALALARSVKCPDDSVTDMLNCLRDTDATTLISATVSNCAPAFNGNWAPRIDNNFIHAAPEELLKSGNFSRVDFLSGTVPDEVSDEFTDVPDIEVGFSRQEKERRMYTWSRRYNELADLMHAAVVHEYDSPGDIYSEQRDLFLEMRSDFEYIAPHNAHAAGHSSMVNKTFLYSFEYRSANIPTPEWMGIPHFEEVYYTFGTPFWPVANISQCPWGCTNVVWQSHHAVWDDKDKEMSRNMMLAWIHFAASGYPLFRNGTMAWPQFDGTNQAYMAIGDQWTSNNYYKYRRTQFWNRFTVSLLNSTFDDATVTETQCLTTANPGFNSGCQLAATYSFISLLLCIVCLISRNQ